MRAQVRTLALAFLVVAQAGHAAPGDAPEISRSKGEAGGVVVLWPRIVPRTDDAGRKAMAGQLQRALVDLVKRVLPGRKVDVRPEPERVCPRPGCDAMSVGLVFHHSGASCIVAAVVSAPGSSQQQIIPWVGKMDLKAPTVPFREPPEGVIKVTDFVPCEQVMQSLAAGEQPVIAAIAQTAKVK